MNSCEDTEMLEKYGNSGFHLYSVVCYVHLVTPSCLIRPRRKQLLQANGAKRLIVGMVHLFEMLTPLVKTHATLLVEHLLKQQIKGL